jgi:hypothetical protein
MAPLVVTIGTVKDHPARRAMRAGKGSVPHTGYESAAKPSARKANDAEDWDTEAEDRGRATRMADARTPSPPEGRRVKRVTKVSRGAKAKKRGAA